MIELTTKKLHENRSKLINCCRRIKLDDFLFFYWYGSQLAGLVYKQYIHSNKHTKSQNRNYTEKKKNKNKI